MDKEIQIGWDWVLELAWFGEAELDLSLLVILLTPTAGPGAAADPITTAALEAGKCARTGRELTLL